MDKDTLYKFFEGTASFEEEDAIRQWLESSAEHRAALLKERKVFDAGLLLADEGIIEEKQKKNALDRRSSLRTFVIWNSTPLVVIPSRSAISFCDLFSKRLI